VNVFEDQPPPTFVVAVPDKTTDVADGTATDVNVPRTKHGETGIREDIFEEDQRTLEAGALASSILAPESCV
jgi:hypothetical protein